MSEKSEVQKHAEQMKEKFLVARTGDVRLSELPGLMQDAEGVCNMLIILCENYDDKEVKDAT